MANNSRIRLFLYQAHSTFMAAQSYLFYRYEEQITTTCSLTILGFFFTIILSFLQLKYQGNNNTDSFSTHPKTMRVSVISFLLYCLIYRVKKRFSRHRIYGKFSDLINHIMVFFSSLSLSSAASVLFPDPVSHVVFSLCFLILGGEMLVWIFKKIIEKINEEEEWYFGRRRDGEPIWNYLRRRMNMIVYPMEQRFSLTV